MNRIYCPSLFAIGVEAGLRHAHSGPQGPPAMNSPPPWLIYHQHSVAFIDHLQGFQWALWSAGLHTSLLLSAQLSRWHLGQFQNAPSFTQVTRKISSNSRHGGWELLRLRLTLTDLQERHVLLAGPSSQTCYFDCFGTSSHYEKTADYVTLGSGGSHPRPLLANNTHN